MSHNVDPVTSQHSPRLNLIDSAALLASFLEGNNYMIGVGTDVHQKSL
jgi:hypothetical protein